MSTITIDRAVVEQALGAMNEAVLALDSPYTSETPEEKALRAAIAALRAALNKPQRPDGMKDVYASLREKAMRNRP